MLALDASGDGFCLSEEAARLYLARKGLRVPSANQGVYDDEGGLLVSAMFAPRRDDAVLHAIIRELGSTRASGRDAEVVLLEIPAAEATGLRQRGWRIERSHYGAPGAEDVVERHARWGPAGRLDLEDEEDGGVCGCGCDPRFRF